MDEQSIINIQNDFNVKEKSLANLFHYTIRENLILFLVFVSWIFALWELYLNFRQRKLMLNFTKLPSFLDHIITEEVYKKSRLYTLSKNLLGNIQDIYGNIFNTVYMTCWGYKYCWTWSEQLVEFCGLDPNNEFYSTSSCLIIMAVISTFFRDIPFQIYNTFVLEQKYNFNKETPLFFFKDQILKFIVSMVVMIPVTCGMIWIIRNGGNYFFLYLWIFAIFMSLILMIIYPELIAPLFDKYIPLPQGELRYRIEALASSVNYPLYKLFIVEGSKRSTHSNAYLYGFFKHKRIVLFDTLIADYEKIIKEAENKNETDEYINNSEEMKETKELKKIFSSQNDDDTHDHKKDSRGCTTDEIVSVLAHELGHWHHSHAIKGFIFAQITLLINFVLFAQLFHYTPIYESFGFFHFQPVLIGLFIVTSHILEPFNKLIGWGMTVISRIHEFQADAFARELGYAKYLKTSLIKLQKDNLGYPLFDKLYSNWYHSHPPLLERLDALKKEN